MMIQRLGLLKASVCCSGILTCQQLDFVEYFCGAAQVSAALRKVGASREIFLCSYVF